MNAEEWIAAYGQAWAGRDPAAVVALFTEDAVYRSSPFRSLTSAPTGIRDYWTRATSTQEELDLRFGDARRRREQGRWSSGGRSCATTAPGSRSPAASSSASRPTAAARSSASTGTSRPGATSPRRLGQLGTPARARSSLRRRCTGAGRTSRSRRRPRSPASSRSGSPLLGREPGESCIEVSVSGPRTRSVRTRRVEIPVGALPDARLALEPAVVRLLDVLHARREDVEDEAAAGLEQVADGSAAPARRSASVSRWRSARNGEVTSRTRSVDRRVAQVAEPEVEEVRRRPPPRRAAGRPRASRRTSRRR